MLPWEEMISKNLSSWSTGSKRRSLGGRVESGGTKGSPSFLSRFASGSRSTLFLFLIALALPLRTSSAGEWTPPWNRHVPVHMHLCTYASLTPSSSFHRNQRLVANLRTHYLHGSLARWQNSLPCLSCLLYVANSWRQKAIIEFAIVIQLPNPYLRLPILNHTGPPDTRHTSSAVTDLLVFM